MDKWNVLSVLENAKDFKGLESGIFRLACREAQEVLSKLLLRMDEVLFESKPASLRSKGFRAMNLPTVFGVVQVERRLYEDRDRSVADGKYRYLLDEMVGLPGGGRPSPMLMELGMQLVTEESFRNAARVLDTLGVSLSHQTLHNWKEELGRQRRQEEEQLRKGTRVDDGDKKACQDPEVLFAEADGVIVHLQREQRRKAEIRVGMLHEGWEPVDPSGRTYRLAAKSCHAGVETAEEFWEQMQVMAMERCDISSTPVVLNTDGADCYAAGREYFPRSIYQLDRFHWIREVRQTLRGYPKAIRQVMDSIESEDADRMNNVFASLMMKASPEDSKKLEKLCNYLNKNWGALRPYYRRHEPLLEGVKTPLRGMGAMESNNFRIVTSRMKHRGASWTVDGADNMARLLALQSQGQLGDWLAAPGRLTATCDVPQEVATAVATKVRLKEAEGKGYEPKQGHLAPLDGSEHDSYIHRFFRRIGTESDAVPWAG